MVFVVPVSAIPTVFVVELVRGQLRVDIVLDKVFLLLNNLLPRTEKTFRICWLLFHLITSAEQVYLMSFTSHRCVDVITC